MIIEDPELITENNNNENVNVQKKSKYSRKNSTASQVKPGALVGW